MAEKLKMTNGSVMGSIRDMSVNEEIYFPLDKMLSVRTICTNIGTQLGRRYTTKVDRENGIIIVNRVS